MSGPIVYRALWLAVITAAGGQCECSSACGKKHKDGRCSKLEGQGLAGKELHLSAIPQDLGLPVHKAATLPARELKAVCPECFKGITAASKRAAVGRAVAATEQDSLF